MTDIQTITENISAGDVQVFRRQILEWYDRHRRVLPWRALKGEQADPYKVWLSEIMLQQTTVTAVIPYFLKFTEKWPSVYDLAQAPEDDVMQNWAGLGYYARARNLIKCAKAVVAQHNGVFPSDLEALRKLPGIGEYTSAAIASIAYDQEATVVDGNVERVMARYHAYTEPLPMAKKGLKTLAYVYAQGQEHRTSDYAQALMDLGATICTPKSPLCALCPVNKGCMGYQKGVAETLPARAQKAQKPHKIGNVFWIENDNSQVLIEKRPEKGLLGGMLGLPTSEWVLASNYNKDSNPKELNVTATVHSGHEIKHSFTHFDLTLKIMRGHLPPDCVLEDNSAFYWLNLENIPEQGFPTVFRKAIKLSYPAKV